MTTITTMFPAGSSQAESPGGYALFDRRHEPPSAFARPHSREQLRVELPRPFEPRPSYQLQTALSDSSVSLGRQDNLNSHHVATHSQGQNLPGLRDIFSSRPSEGQSHAGHGTNFPPVSPAGPRRSESFQRPPGLHPPLVLHRDPALNQAYYPTQDRREVPILDTRHPSQNPPLAPYTPRHDVHRDFSEVNYHRRQDSTVSYLSHSGQSPYTPVACEDRQYGLPSSILDRPQSASYPPPPPPPPGPENQGKYLGVREIPGEGQFHFYESGLRIPTQVDGEQVNPAWGLTKANKPRKRLAAACLDCREKKIKCEPGLNSCLQCDKAKRNCRRPPAQNHHEGTPSTTWSASAGSPARTHGGSDPTPAITHDADLDSASKRRQRDGSSPTGAPSKKHRSASPMLAMSNSSGVDDRGSANPVQSAAVAVGMSSRKDLCWQEDPYAVDPETTVHLLGVYFAHVNDATYAMLPRRPFMRWVREATYKCDNERMVLYAILALASVFAGDSYRGFGKRCFLVATDAVASKQGKFSLLLAQTRLLLGLYNFAKGSEGPAWDYCGAAIQVANGLRLNTEEGCLDGLRGDARPHWEFHYTSEQVAESRRRTFWSLFLMDRVIGFCCGTQCIINTLDVFLRLPCSEERFEAGSQSDAPFLNNGIIDPSRAILTASSPVSPMAWLILGAVQWGNVLTFLNRAVYRAPDSYAKNYEDFYSETQRAIQGWMSRLPDHLAYRESNLERSIQHGYAGAFVGIHIFHHLTMMKLNRWARHSLVPASVPRNIRKAHEHAQKLLGIMHDIKEMRRDLFHADDGQPHTFAFSSAFAGFATLSAIDIVAAGGMDQNLKSTVGLIEDGHACLLELERYWNSARAQAKDAHTRLLQIRNVIQRPDKSKSGCWLGRQWGIKDPMEVEFGREDDCIYGVDDAVYFAAFDDAAAAAAAQRRKSSSGALRIA